MQPLLSRLWRSAAAATTLDWILACILTVGAELAIWIGGDAAGHHLRAALLAPAIVAPIAVRRRHPAIVGAGVPLLAGLEHAVWGSPQFVGYPVAYFCALYGLTVWTPLRRFLLGWTSIVVAGLIVSARSSATLHDGVTFTVVTAVVMLIVRRVVGDRERRAALAERERDLAAREAVVGERARIARELHDAIAHNVSMIVVQAGGERRALHNENAATREVLETIEQIGRGVLTEMRRLVGMLRSDADDPLAPQPGLADLPMLVMQVREAGLSVEFHVEGERRELPVGIELSAYRIVQEALTNSLKHAGDARAAVHVRYGTDSLELEIVDDGEGASSPVSGGGHGLVGMRERVALYGGRLDAGRRPSGGFTVRVVLPIR